MSGSFFKFKQFTVHHNKCAMKVGTDGVLLAVWTKIEKTSRILDVGTGSGLISLIMAQRDTDALVDSIEIDEQAYEQALQNFINSSFADRIKCFHIPFRKFVSETKQKYDIIVSNPPFFTSSLKSPDKARTIARHADELLLEDLMEGARSLLNERGKLSFIFPFFEKKTVITLAEKHQLYISRITNVYPTISSSPKRILVELGKNLCQTCEDSIIIEHARHHYSPEFIQLTKDFYLKM